MGLPQVISQGYRMYKNLNYKQKYGFVKMRDTTNIITTNNSLNLIKPKDIIVLN